MTPPSGEGSGYTGTNRKERGVNKMAELPEIAKLAGQMRHTLCGKTIQAITLLQEKCANIPPGEFQERVIGAQIEDIRNKGKWIVTSLDNGENILLSLGMGADMTKDLPLTISHRS